MFLRGIHRKKDGKDHRYFSIVENHRSAVSNIVAYPSFPVNHNSAGSGRCAERRRALLKKLSFQPSAPPEGRVPQPLPQFVDCRESRSTEP